MGYAESVLLVLALGCFLALRPPPAAPRPYFAVAGLLAFVAALTRPIGVLLFLAVGVELVRWWPRLGRGERAVGLGAVTAPFLGVLCFLAWSSHVVGDWWAPLASSSRARITAGSGIRSRTLYHDAHGVLHHHVGTALHVPWVLLALAMLRGLLAGLPATYTLFAAGVLATALGGANLDSFERYTLSAFPLTIAAAVVLTESQLERAVLALLSAGLAGYALLAFLNVSVP